MSEAEIGVFGQLYGDRKSSKTGKLLRKEPENHSVILIDVAGDEFSVNETVFRNNWRKIESKPEADEYVKPAKQEPKKATRRKETVMQKPELTDEEKQNIRDYLDWRKENIKGSKNEDLEKLVSTFEN